MSRLLLLALCLLLSACALQAMHTQEPPPAAPLTAEALLLDPAPIACVNLVQLPALAEQPQEKAGKRSVRLVAGATTTTAESAMLPTPRSGKALSVTEIVTRAQKAALVQPTEKTYFGRTADTRYTWQPGQIYTVLVAPGEQTMITLPPKEVLLIGLALDEKEFLVVNKKVGREDGARYVISLTPQEGAKGQYQVSLLTDSGHQYPFKLIVGTVSMRSVTFEVPIIHEERE